jgi:hypothetical protein
MPSGAAIAQLVSGAPGVIYAEQHRLADADALNVQLTRPEDRARFALGVLMEMSQ